MPDMPYSRNDIVYPSDRLPFGVGRTAEAEASPKVADEVRQLREELRILREELQRH